MNAGDALRAARERAGLSLRELARRAGTSHSTLAAYEAGVKVPSVDTMERIIRATGHEFATASRTSVYSGPEREAELLEVLELAAAFPVEHSATLVAPVFGR